MAKRRFRYEITLGEVVEQAHTRAAALTLAERWVFIHQRPAVVTDTRALPGMFKHYDVKPCTGAAHSNPHIDHCAVCMPNWGVITKGRPATESEA